MKNRGFICDDDEERARVMRDAEVARSGALVARILVHDANNMLNVILAASTPSLTDGMAEEPRSLLALATEKLASILARLGAHQRAEGQARPVSPGRAINSLLSILRVLTGDRALITQIEDDLPDVWIDPIDLERAIINLITNARDATPPAGTIVLGAQLASVPAGGPGGVPAGIWVDVFVEDRGAGMDPATLANATLPFFTTKRGRGGSGLGLASVARVVHAAGGHFQITSVAGVGTTVHLWLPPMRPPARSP
jgi:signal transduction histidine kinase